MKGIAFGLLAALAACGCGGSLTAPTTVQQPAAAAVAADAPTISGQIYSSVGPIYPALANVLVEVNEANGASATTVTDADGNYHIAVPRGSVTITATKDGYEAKQWQFDLLNDVVLNFSLIPQ